MQDLFMAVGFGIVTAAILALSSVAFTLEYAVSNVPNLAHGEILTAGAYAAYVVNQFSNNIWLAVLAAVMAGAFVGWLTEIVIIEPFTRNKSKPLVIFIATLGGSLVIQNVLLLMFGGASVSYQLHQGSPRFAGPFFWTPGEEQTIVAALVILVGLYLLLQRSKFGKALRAVAQNHDLARVSGIPANTVVRVTWAIAGGIAGFAGLVLAGSVGAFAPDFGFSYLIVTITAAVAGGLGKPYGTMAGALVVGLVMEIAAFYLSSTYKLAIAFAILVILLLFRPNGLFSSKAGVALE